MSPAPDPLDELRARVEATREAAERLAGEAAEAARDAAEGRVPPQGWASPEDRERTAQELQAAVALLQGLREVVPEELWQQIREVVRQLLLLVRAIIDWWVERIESGPSQRGAEPDVEDIPIA